MIADAGSRNIVAAFFIFGSVAAFIYICTRIRKDLP